MIAWRNEPAPPAAFLRECEVLLDRQDRAGAFARVLGDAADGGGAAIHRLARDVAALDHCHEGVAVQAYP